MLLERYQESEKLFNVNFVADAGAGLAGYRGELVLVAGEVGDSAGRRKPPVKVLKEAVLLVDEQSIRFASGLFDDAADVPLFVQHYQSDLANDAKLQFFVVNLPQDANVTLDGVSCELVALPEGIVWNSLLDHYYLEKSDFKGQSNAEKIKTVYAAAQNHTSKAQETPWDAVLASRTSAKRVTRGAL